MKHLLNDHYQLFLILNFCLSGLFILMAIPLFLRKIPPNPYYGVRLAKSFKSAHNWYEINAYYAKHWLIWSVLQFVITLIAACFRNIFPFNVIFTLLFFPLIPVVMTLIHMRRHY